MPTPSKDPAEGQAALALGGVPKADDLGRPVGPEAQTPAPLAQGTAPEDPSRDEEFTQTVNHPFVIDTERRKIVPLPAVRIGDDSRAFAKLHPDFKPSGALYATATPVALVNNAAEVTLFEYTVPRNTVSMNDALAGVAGNVFRAFCFGTFSTATTGTLLALRFKVNGSLCHDVVFTGQQVGNVPFAFTWYLFAESIGTAGSWRSALQGTMNGTVKDQVGTSANTVDTTADLTLKVTGDFSAASSSNAVSAKGFLLELLN